MIPFAHLGIAQAESDVIIDEAIDLIVKDSI